MKKDSFEPYFEAVKQILYGNHVKELDDIRMQCNEAFLTSTPESARGYTPEAIIISFVADAENKILTGADPVVLYSGFKGLELTDFRQRGRLVLEHAIQRYLK